MLCVISKLPIDDNGLHSIRANSLWTENPYADFAVVPEDMIEGIMETKGFCDIVLNDDNTEVISFTARDIPEMPVPEMPITETEQLRADVDYIAIMAEVKL